MKNKTSNPTELLVFKNNEGISLKYRSNGTFAIYKDNHPIDSFQCSTSLADAIIIFNKKGYECKLTLT